MLECKKIDESSNFLFRERTRVDERTWEMMRVQKFLENARELMRLCVRVPLSKPESSGFGNNVKCVCFCFPRSSKSAL